VTNALSFRCTGCGECCRTLRVAVTDRDLERLVVASGLGAERLVDWLGPDAVDMSGEPESFVELREGRRLMVLAHGSDGCRLLDEQARCSVYAARPSDCRLFPFNVVDEAPRPRRVELLPLARCDYTRDGQNDERAIARDDAARWRELARYQARIATWNRSVKHRRRLGKRLGGAAEYLAFLGLTPLQ
jgi:Fe-S-cluster containining protein